MRVLVIASNMNRCRATDARKPLLRTVVGAFAIAAMCVIVSRGASSQPKTSVPEPDTVAKLFSIPCIDLLTPEKIEAITRKYNWQKMDKSIADAWRPNASRIDFAQV